jgi:hypothetical protein
VLVVAGGIRDILLICAPRDRDASGRTLDKTEYGHRIP